jgi:type I site-specific restriction endonuclease
MDNKALEKEISPVISKASKIVITGKDDLAKASDILTQINRYADKVKESKESVTKPINESLKAARALFAPLEDRLDEAKLSLRKAMISYQTETQRIADEEAKKIEARIGEGKGKLKFDTAIAKIAEIDAPDKQVGSTTFIATECFEVTNLASLPVDYILPNEVAIRNAMKLGKKLPGVRYWVEQRPRNNR